MYSPKISEENVIRLFHLKQRLKKPMTKLVNDILNEYFNTLNLKPSQTKEGDQNYGNNRNQLS